MLKSTIIAVSIAFSVNLTQAMPDAVNNLITGDLQAKETAVQMLSSESPESLAVWLKDFSAFPPPDTTGWAIRLDHQINDSLTAPAWLFIPSGYDYKKPTPLVISLHGGVSGAKFRDAAGKNWIDEPVVQLAEENGWLVLYPLGMTGCAWWDKTGMQNILWFVKEIKRRFNVDDNQIAMCGFSDGGSGSYHFGMLAPTDFAVFFPWSGSPAVGTLVSGIQTYLANLQSRPLFVSNGGKDQLYPAKGCVHMLYQALSAGSHLSAAFYDTAGHNYGYMPAEWSKMTERFNSHRRDPFPPSIYFETADRDFAECDWVTVDELDTSRTAADWHIDYNDTLKDERLTIGFNPDMEYKGKGVRVGFVGEDKEAPAFKAGIQPGDILIQIDDIKIVSMDDVNRAKVGKKRGDPIKLAYKRGKKTIKYETSYPPAREFAAFPREQKSGAIKACHIGNSFYVETSRIASFSLELAPELVRFDQPVVVFVNDQECFNGSVEADSKVLLDEFMQKGDRCRQVFARLTIQVPKE